MFDKYYFSYSCIKLHACIATTQSTCMLATYLLPDACHHSVYVYEFSKLRGFVKMASLVGTGTLNIFETSQYGREILRSIFTVQN